MKDNELVLGIKAGNEKAWEKVVRLHQADLYACAAKLLGTGPDAENVLQETWLTAHLKMQTFEWRGEGSLYGWLRQICLYKAFEVVRQNHRLVASETERLEELSEKAARQAHQEHTEQGERQALVQLIRQVLRKLGEPCARLLELRELQGASYVKLAKDLGKPMGTIMSSLARCRRLLREAVAAALGEEA